MSTSTSRLQLTKPLGSESMALGAAQLTDAWLKVDAAMGVKKFATSGAATATFNGDLILETSTGRSLLFNSPNWPIIFDDLWGRGKAQATAVGNPSEFPDYFGEDFIFTKNFNVEGGRKYLVQASLALSGVNQGGTPSANQGYHRLNFYYTTNLAADPNIFIHDVAVYISAINSSRSKNVRFMFEWFPNMTATVKFGMTSIVVSGNEALETSITGSNPNITLIDWGV